MIRVVGDEGNQKEMRSTRSRLEKLRNLLGLKKNVSAVSLNLLDLKWGSVCVLRRYRCSSIATIRGWLEQEARSRGIDKYLRIRSFDSPAMVSKPYEMYDV